MVDERVTDGGNVRITMISYSDGSVDRFSAIKEGADLAEAAGSPVAAPEPSGSAA